MSYETGSASSPNDLLDKLRIFALANGWTVDYYGNRTNAGGGSQGNGLNALAVNKGGLYAVFFHDTSSNTAANPTPRILTYTYPGPWVGTAGSDLQAGKTENAVANNLPGPYQAYHFFTDPARTYLHVALEVVSGRFSHFGAGIFDKAGGGAIASYAYGLRWSYATADINAPDDTDHDVPFDGLATSSGSIAGGVVRADSDGISPRNYRINSSGSVTTAVATGGFRGNGGELRMSSELMQQPPSALTGRPILIPLIISVVRATASQRSIIGTPFDMRCVRIDNLLPGDVLTIGADQWKAFPVIRKNGGAGIESSGVYGYAYRIVP